MKKIEIVEQKNGYLVTVHGCIRVDGPYVYKATELLQMLAFIGDLIIDAKVTVERR